MKKYIRKLSFLLMSSTLMIFVACESFLPDNLDVLDEDTRFTQTVYKPQLGRNTLMDNNFNPGNSSRPFEMRIVNMRALDGSAAPELIENFPVKVWKKPYLANEKSLKEIEDKRSIEYHTLFSIRDNGSFIMWSKANSSFVRTLPDSCYVFDVEVKNTGGRKYFKNFKLLPSKERDYEPSIYDPEIGVADNSFVRPLSVDNIKGKNTSYEITEEDIEIYFFENKLLESDEKTLTFKFFDKEYTPIDPANFNLTDWSQLVHGFDMEMTNEHVRYKVAYPIPLIENISKYTNNEGVKAHTVFSYDRLNAGGFREIASLVFDFSIYTEGHWEINIVFSNDSPKFEND